MALTFPKNYSDAYQELVNGSVVQGPVLAYSVAWGQWFWPLIFLVTLIMVYVKSENPAFVVMYAVLGDVALGAYLLPEADKIFYVVIVLSFALVLFKLFGSRQS